MDWDGDDVVSGRVRCGFGEWVWRGMMFCGISHLLWSDSVIWILSRSFVSKLWTNRQVRKLYQLKYNLRLIMDCYSSSLQNSHFSSNNFDNNHFTP